MARKEKKSAALPKRLAGVKIPRNVRDGLVKLARNPMVADLLAAGLVALAANLRDNSAKAEPAADAPKPATKPRVAKAAAPAKPAAAKPAAPKPAATGKPKAPAKKAAAEGAPARKPTVRATSRTKH